MAATVLAVVSVHPVQGQQDVRGSADHPLLPNRMPGFYISNYRQTEFAAHKFQTPKGPVTLEGRVTHINYRRPREVANPGGLAIRRNYENAIREIGGEVVHHLRSMLVLRATTKDGAEVWVELIASDNASAMLYQLTILERTAMKQVITADALAAAIDKDGFVSVSIEFEFASASVKPESAGSIDAIAAMLAGRPTLALIVEGHTDDVGAADANKKLSQARAEAVVAAIVRKGIGRPRLDPMGYGEERPVADNKTEEGRAKNRRVTLVRK
jgi:outer membrane protein OmpA-like peptidoglycan-associated protein